MKKYIMITFFIAISLLSFSYVYISGKNVADIGQDITLVGYDDNPVNLTVYKILNPLNVIKGNETLEKTGKSLYKKILLSPDKKREINYKINFSEAGMYFFMYVSSDGNKSYSQVLVTSADFISSYDGNKYYAKSVERKNGKSKSGNWTVLTENNELTFNNSEKLDLSTGKIKMVIFQDGDNIAFNKYYSLGGNYSDEKGTLIFDKPVYKPGDNVNFKGYLLKLKDEKYVLESGKNVQIIVKTPDDNIIYQENRLTGDYGDFSENIFLSDDAPTGYYPVRIITDEQTKYDGFVVQNYEKPEFTVDTETEKEEYNSGDIITFKVKAKYYDNSPLRNAQANFFINYYGPSDTKQIYQGISFTDGNGELNVSVKAEDYQNGDYYFTVQITDSTQRTIEGFKYVQVYSGDYKIKTEFTENKNNNYSITLNGTVTDRNDITVDSGEASVTLYEDEDIISVFKTQIIKGNIKIDSVVEKFGNYRLKIEYGNSEISLYKYINEKDNEYIDFTAKRNGKKIDVNFKYKNYETGILIISGENIYYTEDMENKNDFYEFDIPENIPEKELFVTYMIYNRKGYTSDTQKIDISDLKSYLYKYEITSDKEKYEPGEKVTLKIKAPEDGLFTVSVVDKKLYEIYQNKDVISEIYPSLYYTVVDFGSTNGYMYFGYISKINEDRLHTFTSFKDKAETNKNTREYFTDTALWLPSLKTVNGEAEIEFTNPDNITTWQVNAYGFTKDKVNQISYDVISSKDFFADFRIKDYIYINDEVYLNMVLNNNTEKELTIKPDIQSENGKTEIDFNKGELKIPSMSSYVFPVFIKPIETGTDYLVFDFGDDIVKVKININETDITKDFSDIRFLGEYIEKGETYRKFNLKNLLDEINEYMGNYPYNCVEQSSSKIRVKMINDIYTENHTDNILKDINSYIQKIYKYQRPDGGWGWYSYDESNPFLTYYVLDTVQMIKNNYKNIYISENIFNNSKDYISTHKNYSFINYYIKKYYGEFSETDNKSISDYIFDAFYNDKSYEYVMNNITVNDDIAYVKFGYYDFMSENYMNMKLLELFIERKNTEIANKIMKYLIINKSGHYWYNTLENSLFFEIIYKNIDKFQTYFNDSKPDYIKAENNFEISDGIYEIFKTKKIEENSYDENNFIRKNIYKKISLSVKKPDGTNTSVDYFTSEGNVKIPDNITVNETPGVIEKNGYIYWNYKNINEKIFENDDLSVENYDGKIFINGKDYGYYQEIIIKDSYIYLIGGNKISTYNIRIKKIIKTYENAYSIDFLNGKEAVLYYNDDEKYLLYNDKEIKVPSDSKKIDVYDEKIYIIGDYTYIADILNGTYEKTTFDFTADRIIDLSGDSVVLYGNIKFVNNNSYSFGNNLITINYSYRKINFEIGDMIKVKLNFRTEIPSYFTLEDYVPVYSEFINFYSEKIYTENYKYSNYWYSDWNYWYSGYETNKNRITFFSNGYGSGEFDYYYRLTNKGKFNLPQPMAYNMYLENSVITWKKDLIKVQQ